MSMDLSSERVCYLHCNFCNTILAVGVPYSNMFTFVTVRCGHCANLLSLNMGASVPTAAPIHDLQLHKQQQQQSGSLQVSRKECVGSSSKCTNASSFHSLDLDAPPLPPVRPPEKRQRVPSAYNRFIKEEIQRIKASNPDITHREAFSTAAKNWAHFPHIHFGLKLDGNKQGKQLDQNFAGNAHKSNGNAERLMKKMKKSTCHDLPCFDKKTRHPP